MLRRLFSSVALKQRVLGDLKGAIKEKNAIQAEVLKLIINEINLNEKISKPIPSQDVVVRKMTNRWDKSIEDYQTLIEKETSEAMKQRMKEEIEKNRKELSIIESYLPPAMTEEQVNDILEGICKAKNVRNFDQTTLGLLLKEAQSTVDFSRITTKKLTTLIFAFLDKKKKE